MKVSTRNLKRSIVLKLRTRVGCLLFLLLFIIVEEVLINAIGKMKYWKGRNKTYLHMKLWTT